jgi:hypothetical protein
VTDRAKYISIINEFNVASNNNMTYLKMTTRATPPNSPAGPSLLIVLIVTGGLGLFFSVLYALVVGYYRILMAVER